MSDADPIKPREDSTPNSGEIGSQNDAAKSAAEGTKESPGIVATLHQLEQAGGENDDDEVSVGDVVNAFGGRAYGPLLLLPAFLALFPITGGIPGASIAFATIIILIGVQMLFRSEGIWLPGPLKRMSIRRRKIRKVKSRTEAAAGVIDRFLARRLEVMTSKPVRMVAAVACIGLAITMYPLALVPMGAALPSAAIILIAIAITANDGIMMTIGLAATAGCAWFTWRLLA